MSSYCASKLYSKYISGPRFGEDALLCGKPPTKRSEKSCGPAVYVVKKGCVALAAMHSLSQQSYAGGRGVNSTGLKSFKGQLFELGSSNYQTEGAVPSNSTLCHLAL